MESSREGRKCKTSPGCVETCRFLSPYLTLGFAGRRLKASKVGKNIFVSLRDVCCLEEVFG